MLPALFLILCHFSLFVCHRPPGVTRGFRVAGVDVMDFISSAWGPRRRRGRRRKRQGISI